VISLAIKLYDDPLFVKVMKIYGKQRLGKKVINLLIARLDLLPRKGWHLTTRDKKWNDNFQALEKWIDNEQVSAQSCIILHVVTILWYSCVFFWTKTKHMVGLSPLLPLNLV
jgi:hypothetical protein